MNTDTQVRRNWSSLLLAWTAYFFGVCAAMALLSRAWFAAVIIAMWATGGVFAAYGSGAIANVVRWVFWLGVAALLVFGTIALYLH